MNSNTLTYPGRYTVIAANGINSSACHLMACAVEGLSYKPGATTPWGDYITERCVTAGEFGYDVCMFIIHPDHDRDEFLGELLTCMARGDSERFVELCRVKGWVPSE